MIGLGSNTELDSHANVCVLSWNAHIFLDHEQPENGVRYDKSKGIIDKCLSTISGALAYDNTVMGLTIMLIIHQAINVPTMGNNLLCPMQIWMDDISLDDTPKVLTENPTCKMYRFLGLTPMGMTW